MEKTDDFETIEYLETEKKKDKKDKKKKKKEEKENSILSNIIDAAANTNFKLLIFIFIIFIFINSDLFIDKILSRIDGTVEHRATTSKGVIVQGICIVLLYVMADVMIQIGVI